MFVKVIWLDDKDNEVQEVVYHCDVLHWLESNRLVMEGVGNRGTIDIMFENSKAYVYIMNENGKTIDSRFMG